MSASTSSGNPPNDENDVMGQEPPPAPSANQDDFTRHLVEAADR
jgi:hypothetical protein